MTINASVPSFDPSQTNNPIRKIFPKKREITLTDARDQKQNPIKIMGEIFTKPPKLKLLGRGKVILELKIKDGEKSRTVYAKVDKKALDSGLGIKKEEFANKRTIAESSELVQSQILHKRFQLALEEKNPTLVQKRREEVASLGSKDAAYQLAIDYLADFGIKGDFSNESISRMEEELEEDKQTELKELLENAATLGSGKAMEALGALSKESVDKIAWYKAAAEHGSLKSMWIMGRSYQVGLESITDKGTAKEKRYTVPKDPDKALDYFNRYLSSSFDEAERAKAHAAIGSIYKEMDKVDMALKHFELASEKDKTVFHEMGDLYVKKALLAAREDKDTDELTDEEVFDRILKTQHQKAEALINKALQAYNHSTLDISKLSWAKLTFAILPYRKGDHIKLKNEIELKLDIAVRKDPKLEEEAEILLKRLKIGYG